MQRTQIYLPEDLRREIDKDRRESGESLADYLREAAKERLRAKKKKKADLKRLAEEVVGSLKIDKETANRWVREIREERRLEDEHWEKRWNEAVSRIKKN